MLKSAALSVINKTIAKTAEEGSRTIVLATMLDEKEHGHWLNRNKIKSKFWPSLVLQFKLLTNLRVSKVIMSPEGNILQKKVWSEALDVLAPYGIKQAEES